MAIQVKWYGNEVLKKVHLQNKQLVKCVATTISRKAKELCSVKTGTLKRSIRAIVTEDKAEVHAGGPAGCAPGVGSPVEYAGHVELGTSNPNYPAQPYLRPAVEKFSAADLKNCVDKIK